jgi:hypothetical protein
MTPPRKPALRSALPSRGRKHSGRPFVFLKRCFGAALLLPLACLAGGAAAVDGRELMEESLRRHAPPPFVYEEQALVLSDRQGQLGVRTMRYYARRDANGSRNLRVIETPAESKGNAIYVGRDAPDGRRHGAAPSAPVFGSNFTVVDLEDEQVQDFHYQRETDHDIDRVPHHALRAVPASEAVAAATNYRERRLYLRKDNLFVTRIEYKDRQGRLARHQTFRDPRPEESGAWRANMILMEDLVDGRRSLLKTERRAHSPDYVPADIFAGWQARP